MEVQIYLLERKCLLAFKKLEILKAVYYDNEIKKLKALCKKIKNL